MDSLENCEGRSHPQPPMPRLTPTQIGRPGSAKYPMMTLGEARSQFATFAILGSTLILGNDPRHYGSYT